MNPLNEKWDAILSRLAIAFQPIVNIHTGKCYGVEALLRGSDTLGFKTIHALFDAAYEEGVLYAFDLGLREKVMQCFIMIESYEHLKLFLNIDNRILEYSDYMGGNTSRLCDRYDISNTAICIELSERHEIVNTTQFEAIIAHYAHENFQIVIDDYGSGYSGHKLLYQSTPDIIKIDRFFISDIGNDRKKKLMVRAMVQQAGLMGITVVAEGVETEQELQACREIGFNWAQGFFIQRPQTDPSALSNNYPEIRQIRREDQRGDTLKPFIKKRLQKIAPIHYKSSMHAVLERFGESNTLSILPVVDNDGIPLGILHEQGLKKLVYSPYGRSLLLNESAGKAKLKKYLQRCGVADIHNDIETIIELFSTHEDAEGILITKNLKYVGYLSARSLVELIHERNLASARDQNPLTRLPGNLRIERYIATMLESNQPIVLCYFDFNHFKPFNDTYGFRNGDRVIQLFADLLNKHLPSYYFKGHIGGDDFFIGVSLEQCGYEDAYSAVVSLVEHFKEEVKGFYSAHDRENNAIMAKDRDGIMRCFALLEVSAVVIELQKQSRNRGIETLQRCFSLQKKSAKALTPPIISLTLL